MEQRLLIITCTTCQARLTVRDESLIGHIVACPKCQSMVQVTAPEGWTPSASDQPMPHKPTPDEQGEKTTEAAAVPETPTTPQPTTSTSSEADRADKPSQETAPAAASESNGSRWTRAAAVVPPPLPKERPLGSPGPVPEVPLSVEAGLSPAEHLWRGGLLWGGLAVAGVVFVAGLLLILLPSNKAPSTDEPVPPIASNDLQNKQNKTPEVTPPVEPEPPVELPSAESLDPFWIPDDARLVVSVAPSRLADRSGVDRLFEAAGPFWEPVLGRVAHAFALRRDELRRVTWSTADLDDLAARGTVVIEVEPDCDLDRLVEASRPTDSTFRGKQCRRLTETDWTEPFALTGPRTIVTGQAELLKTLGSRDKPHLTSRALAKMFEGLPRDAELTVLVDLEAVRQAHWRLPDWAMNAWPPGVRSWQTLWRVPQGLGVYLRRTGGTMHSRADLVCADEPDTEKVLSAVERLVPTGKAALADKLNRLTQEDKKPDREKAYDALLQAAVDALTAARWEPLGTTVRLTADCRQDLLDLGLLVLDSREAIRLDWKTAIASIVEGQQKRLVDGLDDYRRAKGYYPAAATGGALLPPETRLSWIAMLLPYYGHPDWAEQLEPGYAWDAPKNVPVTSRVLPEVVNPAFGPSMAEGRFPVTHYVGSAGLGQHAGRLDVNDARAGMFGFGRKTLPSQIIDGASNTIAVLGTRDELGPWAAGGHATVRGLTQQPYVNGPDGFSTGQADGMFVGMADGSVRFLSKDVDPRIIEHMVTINGGEAPLAIDDRVKEPKTIEPTKKPDEVEPVAADEGPKPAAEDETVVEDKGAVEIPPEIAARLDRPLESVKFENVGLGDLIHMIRQMSTLEIHVDQKSLAKANISLDVPVTIEQEKTTVRQLLAEALAQCSLTFVIRDGQLVVTSAKLNGTD